MSYIHIHDYSGYSYRGVDDGNDDTYYGLWSDTKRAMIGEQGMETKLAFPPYRQLAPIVLAAFCLSPKSVSLLTELWHHSRYCRGRAVFVLGTPTVDLLYIDSGVTHSHRTAPCPRPESRSRLAPRRPDPTAVAGCHTGRRWSRDL